MSTGDGEWGLWKGKDTGLMQVWSREVSERIKGNTRVEVRLDFITHGDKETLTAILELNNAQIRAQHGESK